MKYKLPEKQVFVDREKGIVVAKYSKEPSVLRSIESMLSNSAFKRAAYDVLWGYPVENENRFYTSKAVCDRRDTFDEKIGIDIASEKVDAKFHINVIQECEYLIEKLNIMISQLNIVIANHRKKIDNINADIKKIGGDC